MFDGLFICPRSSSLIFFWMQKSFIENILAWEIIYDRQILIQLEIFFRACRSCLVKKMDIYWLICQIASYPAMELFDITQFDVSNRINPSFNIARSTSPDKDF